VDSAHEIGLKLVSQIMLILILTRTDDAVPGAIGDNINAPK
jgi:hypothetical protein